MPTRDRPVQVIVNTFKDRTEKYRRCLATNKFGPGRLDLGTLLVGEGHAARWDGRARRRRR